MELLIATTNQGKLREYEKLLASLPARLLSLRDVGLDRMDVEETAETFLGNAELKAIAYARAGGLLTLADDSGLQVDALDGRPGVYSARYAGPGANDEARYTKLLGELAGVADESRTARFVCVISVADPHTLTPVSVTGTCEGRIAQAPGAILTGFGFDPVFIPDGYTEVLSALPMEVKNQLSHRGNAARQIVPILGKMIESRD